MPLAYILISFFQPLLPDFRLITSCHVTAVICLFIVQEIKLKLNKRKNQIKLKKINKKKRKEKENIRVHVYHNTSWCI